MNVLPVAWPRRNFLGAGMGLALHPSVYALAPARLNFPRDAGAHPEYAIEWWYATGYINGDSGEPLFGFQVTFFRSRIARTQNMVSKLAARQLIFAHAAITDIKGKKLWHDQRMARSSGAEPGTNSLDDAFASTRDTAITLQDWSLLRQADGHLQARIAGTDFTMGLTLAATQPVLLQGAQGLSQKGPHPRHSSYYYSLPHLQVDGHVVLRGKRYETGSGSTAWLDHEWSQQLMPPGAVGWDWMGINLLDGSALTAFRLRDKASYPVWAGGSFRFKDQLTIFRPGEVVFKPLRTWKSPLSQASYPVEWEVRTPAGSYTVRAVLDNQEMDSRMSTGAIYWEGLCDVLDTNDRLVGRGYLEMTGYATPMRL